MTAVAGVSYLADTSSASFTITLPASPTTGQNVSFRDALGTWSTNNLLLDPGSNNIQSLSGQFALDQNYGGIDLYYIGGTVGWDLQAATGFQGATGPTGPQGGTGPTGPTGPASSFLPITSFTSSLSLGSGDITRTLRFSSTATASAALTLPLGVSSGWSTGTVSNENLTYAVTIAVGSGAAIDGVTNGTVNLLPYQKASFYYDTDGWHTVWIDRSPIVLASRMNAVSQIIWPIPIGYGSFDMRLSELATSVNGSNFAAVISLDGGSTFITSSYQNDYCGQTAPSSASIGQNTTSTNFYQIIPGTSTSVSASAIVNISGKYAYMKSVADAYGGSADTQYMMRCVQSTNLSQVTALKFFSASGGTMTGNITIRALPVS